MIDLSALGLSSTQTSHHGAKRDKAGTSHEHGKAAKSFGDLVDQAAKKNDGRNAPDDDAASQTSDDLDGNAVKVNGKRVSNTVVAPKLGSQNASRDAAPMKTVVKDSATAASVLKRDDRSATDDDAVLEIGKSVGEGEAGATAPADEEAIDVDFLATDTAHAGTAEPQGRVRLSELTKSGIASSTLHRTHDGKDEVKGDKTENKQVRSSHKDDVPAVKEKTAASPSEELHALLGMTPKKHDAEPEAVDKPAAKPVAKTAGHATDDDEPAKTTHADDSAVIMVKSDAPAVQTVAMQHVGGKLPDSAAARPDADNDRTPADQDTDRLRLVSNDGKGRPLDVELTKPASDDAAKPAAGGKTDFVTVLDSRRYLGFTSDSSNAGNSAALTNAIKAEPSWAQVIHNVKTGAGQTATEVNTLKLQMNPEHLGNMTASLRLKGEELSVEVRVETVDAYRQLSNDQDSIVKALKDQGFSIDQVSIQLSPAARADAGQGSGSQNNSNQSQSGSGQNLQQGGQGDNARQRDESTRRNPNQNNWTGNDSTSTLSDSGTGRGNTDTGNLYL